MKRRAWFYDLSTGIFTGGSFVGSAAAIALNTPEGCGHRFDVVDWMSQRVVNDEVVDYRPTRPSADDEWNDQTKRWQKRADIVDWEYARKVAQARIDELERRQARPMRELRLRPDDAAALAILQDIDAEIARLRAIINAPRPSTGTETNER